MRFLNFIFLYLFHFLNKFEHLCFGSCDLLKQLCINEDVNFFFLFYSRNDLISYSLIKFVSVH